MSSTNPEKTPVPTAQRPSIAITPTLTLQPPLSRRGHGPGLVLLVDPSLDLSSCHDRTRTLRRCRSGRGGLRRRAAEAVQELGKLPSCEGTGKLGFIVYSATTACPITATIIEASCKEAVAVVYYGASSAASASYTATSRLPALAHLPGTQTAGGDAAAAPGPDNVKQHYYGAPAQAPPFAIPAHEHYHAGSASVAHTRTLAFLKPLMGGPWFDLEKIWDEHTYWEFEARDVEQTMATMVEEPYVNHIPTLTGGIGREKLTEFYTNHFVFANPPDTELELVSRTVGIDRVIDEFVTKMTHDRVVDWLIPGVPPTGKYIQVPFTSVVNIRGDRLYHEHISWDQGTLLRQLGLLPEYLPFPLPGGICAARREVRVSSPSGWRGKCVKAQRRKCRGLKCNVGVWPSKGCWAVMRRGKISNISCYGKIDDKHGDMGNAI
ncbi:Carboxymethylenebutenolidase [Apiospora phragmitis]|uniref:Carboxymethylenebutenolidase n=1 Tax=Apiospora phragmitis TaxID=2905665 RepID=A0ABR1USR8_9PEZI